MLFVRARSPDREHTVGHVDPHDPAVPDVASQHAIERSQNLIDRRAYERPPEQDRKSPHQHAQIGHYRSAQRYLTAKSADAPALSSRWLQLELIEERFRHECQLRPGIQTKMERDSVGAHDSNYWQADPEHVPICIRSQCSRIAQVQNAVAIIQLQIQLSYNVEANDAVDFHR